MVTQTRSHFEAFVQRTIPAWLSQPTVPSPGWPGDEAEFEEIRRAALAYHRNAASYRFLELLAKGWRAHEAATGQLERGVEVGLIDGTVRRPEKLVPEALRSRAIALLSQLTSTPGAGAHLPKPLEADLMSLAAGTYSAELRSAEAALQAASTAIKQAQGEAEAERAAELAKPTIRVTRQFSAMGRRWTAGSYQIEVDELEELNGWRKRMAAQAKGRGWDAPEGFTKEAWPPFTVE